MRKGKFLVFLLGMCMMTFGAPSCNPGEKSSPSPSPNPSPVQKETRGTWIWASSINSVEKRANVLAILAQANLNTVFVSMPPVTQNFGRGSADDFLAFIRDAQKKGLSVHGWIENGSRKGTLSRRLKKKQRYADEKYIDFTSSAEQDAQAQWVMDIMELYGNYLDGIHLDYIRYFHSEDVNIDGKMDGVNATIAKIKQSLKSKYPGTYLTATCFREIPNKEETYKEIPEWKMDVPQWFRDWYAANPGSIYHGPKNVSVPMFMKYQQDPISWLKEIGIDGIMPMRYTTYDAEWNQTADYFKSFNAFVRNDPAKVYMGLGWIEKSSPTSSRGYDEAGVVRKIKYGRSIGMKGFVIFILFNHDHDDTPLIDALTVDSAVNGNDAPFENEAESHFN